MNNIQVGVYIVSLWQACKNNGLTMLVQQLCDKQTSCYMPDIPLQNEINMVPGFTLSQTRLLTSLWISECS